MANPSSTPARSRLSRGVVVGLLVIAALVALWAAGLDLRASADRLVAAVRAAGPGWYFLAMALVPLPLAWFTVPAGEAFAAQLTFVGVIGACMGAVAVQVALSYVLARFWLRPGIARLVQRRGHTIPRVTSANALSVALLVRLTPGPPMILGSCVLALAETPFGLYLAVSCAVALPWVCAGVLLGRGLLQGDFTLIASGVALITAVVIAARLWRRRRTG